MWKLTIEDDQASKTVVHLVRDEYTIGRAEDNAIRLTERNISRHHARVQKDGAGIWHIYDVESYNGCYVNGQRVGGGLPLGHGDLVQFGDYRLVVEDESSEQGRSDRVQTVPGLPRLNVSTQSDRLIELVGPEPGSEFALSQRRLIIGRGEECDISINHPSVSRVHAEIIPFGDGRYEVRDLQSANGIRVNAVELPQSLLDARDVLELGDVLLKYIPAGELYIPGADDTQARAALTATPRGLSAWPGAAKVAVGGVVVALALALVLALRGGGGQTELATVENTGSERAAKLLTEARSLLASGDTEAAIAKANAIPQESNLRDSPEFRAIHGAWADSMFEQANKASDVAQKRALLDQIARATSVDSTRRKRAAKELEGLASEAVDISALPSDQPEAVAVVARPQGDVAPRTHSYQPSAAAPAPPASEPAPVKSSQSTSSIVRKNPFDSSGESDSAPPPTNTGAGSADLGSERGKLVSAKNQLKNKAASGQASERDLKMLKALCRQLGDASCSN